MRAQRGTTEVFTYFRTARQHYTNLGIEENNDEGFLRYLGCSKHLKKKMYSRGIKKIYKVILEKMNENQVLMQENQQLKNQLQQKQKI